MSEYNWKKEIDEAISDRPLLTEGFVQRVQTGKKKAGASWYQLCFAVVCLILISTASIFLNKEQEVAVAPLEQREPTQKEKLMAQQKQAEQILAQYFESVRNQDVEGVAKLTIEEPSILFTRFATLDTKKHQTMTVMFQGDTQTILYVKMPSLVGNTIYVQHYIIHNDKKIVEQVAMDEPIVFKEFIHPEKIHLTYEGAPFISLAVLPNREADTEHVLPNGDRFLFYENEENGSLYYEGKFGAAIIGDTTLADVWEVGLMPSENETLAMFHTPNEMMYIYTNEQQQGYQILSGARPEAHYTAAYTIEEFTHPIFFLSRHQTYVGTIEDGQLVMANIDAGIYTEDWLLSHIVVEPVGSGVLVKYYEEYEQRSSYYTFATNRLLIKN